MHEEAMKFLHWARTQIPDLSSKSIVELGSKDVNGSPRSVFSECTQYVGVDVSPGRGVDVVADCRRFDGREGFDLCICMESMEHDPDPKSFVDAAWRSLKKGGVFIVTAAAPPRMPHRCDGTPGGGEYYTNIFPEYLKFLLSEWQAVKVFYDPHHGDVYALAQRPT